MKKINRIPSSAVGDGGGGGECVGMVGAGPILGNLSILSTQRGNTIEKHTQGSTQNSTDTLKQPKGSQFKGTGS